MTRKEFERVKALTDVMKDDLLRCMIDLATLMKVVDAQIETIRSYEPEFARFIEPEPEEDILCENSCPQPHTTNTPPPPPNDHTQPEDFPGAPNKGGGL